jgi:hypothetical protein
MTLKTKKYGVINKTSTSQPLEWEDIFRSQSQSEMGYGKEMLWHAYSSTLPKKRLSGRQAYKPGVLCEISSSHGGEYDVQNCPLGYTAV